MDPFLGEIRMFAGRFAPSDWRFCDGSLLKISDYAALYSLVGTTWGGDGVVNFGLPDLRGRIPVGQGTGSGLSARTIGQKSGSSTVQITDPTMPAHSHSLIVSNSAAGVAAVSAGAGLAAPLPNAKGQVVRYALTTPAPTPQIMSGDSISTAPGGGQAHANVMPYLAIQYIICTAGLYPEQQ